MNTAAVINTCNWGSTSKIGRNLVSFLSLHGVRSFFCYGRSRGEINNDTDYLVDSRIEFLFHVFMSRLFGNPGSYSVLATLRLVLFLKKMKVDTVYGISLHGYYLNEGIFFRFLSRYGIKFVYILIDEYAYRGKCGASLGCDRYVSGCGNCPELEQYPKSWFFDRTHSLLDKKIHCYSRMNHIVFVGPLYTIKKLKASPFFLNIKTEVLNEAIDTDLFSPSNKKILSREMGVNPKSIIILCVAPFSNPMKGGRFFLELARRFEGDDTYSFVYVAFDSSDKSVLPDNMLPIGYEHDPERLSSYYSESDLLVFPSLADTMPNTCLEALACGTPILCFNTSGMPYIVREDIGYLVEPGDIEAMEKIVKRINKKNDKLKKSCRDYALSSFDSEKYNGCLKEIAERI